MAIDVSGPRTDSNEADGDKAAARHVAFALKAVFSLSTLSSRELAKALVEGTVRLSRRQLDLPTFLMESSTAQLARKRRLLDEWLQQAEGLPENWHSWLVSQLHGGATLIRWTPETKQLYVEHDPEFAPPPKKG